MRNSWWVVGLAAVLALGLGGCKKKVGDKCRAGAEYCVADGELFCGADGTLKSMPCHGPKGCKATAGHVSCDTSNAVLGEGCNLTPDSYECTGDKKAAAVCKDEKWVAEATCKGVKGCRVSNDGITCDATTAEAEDPCHTLGNYACSPAKDILLQCTDSKFAPLASCRGPSGCSFREDIATNMLNFRCDTSLGKEGDVCELANDFTCSVDKKAVLVCTGNKWTVHKACGGACSIDANSAVSCNGVIAGRGGGADHSAPSTAPTKPGTPSSKGATADAGAAPTKPAVADAGAAPGPADAGAKTAVDAGAKTTPSAKDAGAPKKR